MDAIQRELRDIPGVTILIYAQTCATEKRRRRKRGTLPEPNKRVLINDLVCEGCGDCSIESNCLSVIPKETPFGRKRQIDQNNCNKDFSCVNGFCPSFVTNEGGQTFIFRATPEKFELVAENQLGDEVFATPTICADRIYLRVAEQNGDKREERLYCIGREK